MHAYFIESIYGTMKSQKRRMHPSLEEQASPWKRRPASKKRNTEETLVHSTGGSKSVGYFSIRSFFRKIHSDVSFHFKSSLQSFLAKPFTALNSSVVFDMPEKTYLCYAMRAP